MRLGGHKYQNAQDCKPFTNHLSCRLQSYNTCNAYNARDSTTSNCNDTANSALAPALPPYDIQTCTNRAWLSHQLQCTALIWSYRRGSGKGPQKVRFGPHTAFIAFSVPFVCDWLLNVPQAHRAAPCHPEAWAGGVGFLVQGFMAGSRCTMDSFRIVVHMPCSMRGHTALGACLLLFQKNPKKAATHLTLGLPLGMGGLGERGGQRASGLAAATDDGVILWSLGLKNPRGYWRWLIHSTKTRQTKHSRRGEVGTSCTAGQCGGAIVH